MKKRHTEEQIITIPREAESGAVPVKALCERHNISEQTFFRWRYKFGGMDVPRYAAVEGIGIGKRQA